MGAAHLHFCTRMRLFPGNTQNEPALPIRTGTLLLSMEQWTYSRFRHRVHHGGNMRNKPVLRRLQMEGPRLGHHWISRNFLSSSIFRPTSSRRRPVCGCFQTSRHHTNRNLGHYCISMRSMGHCKFCCACGRLPISLCRFCRSTATVRRFTRRAVASNWNHLVTCQRLGELGKRSGRIHLSIPLCGIEDLFECAITCGDWQHVRRMFYKHIRAKAYVLRSFR